MTVLYTIEFYTNWVSVYLGKVLARKDLVFKRVHCDPPLFPGNPLFDISLIGLVYIFSSIQYYSSRGYCTIGVVVSVLKGVIVFSVTQKYYKRFVSCLS